MSPRRAIQNGGDLERHALIQQFAIAKLPGYVYGVTHPAWPGHVKIGKTTLPKKRLSNYNAGCPHRMFKYAFKIAVANCHAAEAAAHNRLLTWNVAGTEWYRIHPDDAFALLACLPQKEDCLVPDVD